MYPHTRELDMLHYDTATLRTHIYRMRPKLAETPWRIENRRGHGMYRLIGRTPP